MIECICPGPLIVKEKVLPAFYPRMSGMSQEFFILTFNVTPRETLTRFLIAAFNKGMQVTMEPPGYPLVTATTLTSCLAYLRQAMAMLHVWMQRSHFWWILEVRGQLEIGRQQK